MAFNPLSDDAFHFFSFGTTEDMGMYVPGGYHPVTIGDIFPPSPEASRRRYRVLHKLGTGSFATVWLAKALDPDAA